MSNRGPVEYRVEHKYLVPESLRDALRRVIAPFVRPDAHAALMHDVRLGTYLGYTVRSIYFDTSSFAHFFANEDGLPVRAKPRIRGYDAGHADAIAFLEVKRRNGAVGSKARAPIAFASVPAFLEHGDVDAFVRDSDAFPSARANAGQFLHRLWRFALQPVVLVTYDREPHIGTIEDSLRITFDTSVRSVAYPRVADLYTDEGMKASLRGYFILEVKHDSHFGYPSWLRPFLSTHGIVRRALSKYYTCTTDQGIVHSYTKVRALASADWTSGTDRPDAPLGASTLSRKELSWIR